MENYLTDDAAFDAFNAKVEADKAASKNTSNSNYQKPDYEQLKWVGLQEDKNIIVRIVGRPPVSLTPGVEHTAFDAKEIYFAKVKDDNGKIMFLKLPVRSDDRNHEHIMWRIINKVKEIKWEPDPANPGKNKKVELYKNMPWYETVTKGGFSVEDRDYKFAKGWAGQQVTIMNVIDRMDDWCKENKHTKLLSKRVGISEKDGVTTEWPDTGVPSFGFLTKLQGLTAKYGNWCKYDIGIKRNKGEQLNPIAVVNASKFVGPAPEEVGDETICARVSTEPKFTDEELTYECYDLEKLFAPTSYQKLLRLSNTIKAIDGSLKTHYFEELQSLAEIEKQEYEAKQAEQAETEAAAATTTSEAAPSVQTVTRAPASAAPAETLSAEKTAALKGWGTLTDKEKSQIVDVVLNADGSVKDIVYSDSSAPLAGCDPAQGGCGHNSPQDFGHCPCCGVQF